MRRRMTGKMSRTAKKMTKALLPKAKSELVSKVASALLISERITNGRAIKMPISGVNSVQKAQRCQTHQYHTVAVGFMRMHRLQSRRWLKGARGVR